MSQKFIFTTSPWKDHGKGKWMLSCFISIQLDAGRRSTLAEFPDILDWMQRLADADFFVQWGEALPQPLDPLRSKWDPALYTKLFHGGIQVKGFEVPDLSKLMIKSYPAKHLKDFILDTYQQVGNLKIDELPSAGFFTKDFTRFNELARVRLKTTKPITDTNKKASLEDFITRENMGVTNAAKAVKKNKAIAFNTLPDPVMDFGQFHHFHAKSDNKRKEKVKPVPKPEFEYHDILSIVSSYPVIMRKLGLVIDFELRNPPSSSGGTVRIIPSGLDLTGESVMSSPATAFEFTGSGFFAASRPGSPIQKGYLNIGTPEFEVVQIDTDGAAMKLTGHMDTVNTGLGRKLVERTNYIKPMDPFDRKKTRFTQIPASGTDKNVPAQQQADADDDDDDDREGLPALRSAGIGILKNGLASNMLQKFTRGIDLSKILLDPALTLNTRALMNLAAADRRQPPTPVRPALGAVPIVPKISIAPQRLSELNLVFQRKELIPVPTEVLYADDIVFGYRMDIAYDDAPKTWYSLHKRRASYSFAPLNRPGEPIALQPDEETDEGCIHLSLTEEDDEDDQLQKLNEVIARWEGWSLAVPPVGKAINTGGKEVSTDDDERKKYALDDTMPFRLQVVVKPAPKTLPRLRFGRKYRVKIRTVDIAGNGLPHDVYPEQGVKAVQAGIEYRRYEPLPSPHLISADEIVGGDKKKQRDRDGESLQHMVIRSDAGVDTKTYEAKNLTTIVEDGVPRGTLKYHHEAVRFLTAPRTSQYMAELHGMFDEAIGHPQKAAEIYRFITERDKEHVDKGDTKAEALPVDTGQVDIDYLADPMAAGVVFTMRSDTTFETPWKKGQTKKFSFYFDEAVTESGAGRKFDARQWRDPRSVKIRLVEGSGEPTWENRVFTIPLPKSAIVEISYASFWAPEALDRFSALMPTLKLGTKSADVMRKANEGRHWMLSPWRDLRLVHAVQQPLQKPVMAKLFSRVERSYGGSEARIFAAISVHGSSTDRLDIGASWTEWEDDLSKKEPSQVTCSTHVASIPVIYNDNLLELMRTENAPAPKPDWLPPLTHMFHDTRYRKVAYTPSATTRFREYFTGIIDTARLKNQQIPLAQVGEPVELEILSSARPSLPLVEYAVPAFSWAKADTASVRTHIRTGNIRVYVQRPWYSSGDGERLAVIIAPPGTDPARNGILKRSCTVWGMDPVFDSGTLNGSNFPQQEHFTGGDVIYDNVKLAGEDASVAVAAFKVYFDIEKQLHYADIPVNPLNAYFPFIRLSLARYQQRSLRTGGSDCCLSGIVQADWMQLTPLRTCKLESGRSNGSFTVSLEGKAPFRRDLRVKVTITVERAEIPVDEGLYVSLRSAKADTTILQREFILTQSDIRSGNIVFSETIRLERQQSAAPYRVVVREFELHPGDPLRPENQPYKVAGRQVTPAAERLVFMDVFLSS